MAQQASSAQQREPSMEEILASIRRIIEDNEPARRYEDDAIETAIGPAANDPAPRAAARPEPALADPVQPSARYETPGYTQPAFLPANHGHSTAPSEQAAANPIREDRLRETVERVVEEPPVARVRETPAAPVSELRVAPEARSLEPIPSKVLPQEPDVPDFDLDELTIDESAIDVTDLSAAVHADLREPTDTQWDDAFLKSLDEKADAAPSAFERIMADTQVAAATAEARSAIISAEASRQVAASFGELSDAFAASRRRSFDDIAAEMIRPMLQDWLDNNLPHLVEKLVREEIERVARGG